ncbi:MAG TPA: nucleotidyltransferase family protein, partial [Chlamydiales bacterium]|nr:nucleotidyltransferase family protein [Chlamydiales bacterium]
LYVPNPTDLLLQTCIHGVKYSPVPLIRWVADAMTILKKSEQPILWDRFIELANYAHICRPLYFALQYLVQYFDAPIPQKAILELKEHPSARLENLEYRLSTRGLPNAAAWYRYCLNKGYLTRRAQILHLHQYLQLTARLKSPWYIPPFAIYWIFKRIYRYLYKLIKAN